MPNDEKKLPEPKDDGPKTKEKDQAKPEDLIIDTTDQHPPGWAVPM